MIARHPYIARADGWVAGQRVTAGQQLLLTEIEARFEPVDRAPDPAPPEPGPPPTVRTRRRRAKT